METVSRVANPPPKPLLIYDGDCRFCALWSSRWQQSSGDRLERLPYQDEEIGRRFPELPLNQLENSVHLIHTDGRVYTGAEAVFRAVAISPKRGLLLDCYTGFPLFARFSEGCYRFVSRRRTFFSYLTRFACGQHLERPTHVVVRWIFLRALALVYLTAFVSLWVQLPGLIGSNGILPADQFMSDVRQWADSQGMGIERLWRLPTLCWFDSSDAFLNFQCAAGVALAVLLLIGIAPAPCLFLLWLIYLSLSVVGRDFLSFQWDILLLETGFLAIFLAPLELWPVGAAKLKRSPPSRLVVWLFRWLLFRLMFESGCVKLLSGDELWHRLTALSVHYETQPLPTWIGWWAHQLPPSAQRISCVAMFVVELVVPFLFFMPRRLRFFGAIITALLQVGIVLTGNYTFFNWLTLALCVMLLDDFSIKALLPARLRERFSGRKPGREPPRTRRWPKLVLIPIALITVIVSLTQLVLMFKVPPGWLRPAVAAYEWIAPLRSVNSYGLFAVMTKPRYEIIIEGSNDGRTWLAYEFKWKPGEPDERPKFVAPHQPRLDWQMWFEALRAPHQAGPSPWFATTCIQFLRGAPEVLALIETNPFPENPPRFLRAVVYEYHFTTPAERKQTGNWWKRELKGQYVPPVSLRE